MEANAVLIFLLFFSALVIGFLLAKFPLTSDFFTKRDSSKALDYYRQSVNFLINEQQDAAIDALTAHLVVNQATLETHMALGAMLRKRGEVERAIRLHQKILSHHDLTASQAWQASLALAEDYLKAGLLDRAEILYTDLSKVNDDAIAYKALVRLQEVYQIEGEWLNAIATVDLLCQMAASSKITNPQDATKWRLQQAHFYCELADQALQAGQLQEAFKALDNAAKLQTHLVRITVLRAQIALEHNKSAHSDITHSPTINGLTPNNLSQSALHAAKSSIKKISIEAIKPATNNTTIKNKTTKDTSTKDTATKNKTTKNTETTTINILTTLRQLIIDYPSYQALVLPLFIDVLNRLHSDCERPVYLTKIYNEQPSILLLPYIIQAKAAHISQRDAFEFLMQEIDKWPALATLSELINLLPANCYHMLALGSLVEVLQKQIEKMQTYECQNCGYSAKEHYWQCPSCKNWVGA